MSVARSIYKIKDCELMYKAYTLKDADAKCEVKSGGLKKEGILLITIH